MTNYSLKNKGVVLFFYTLLIMLGASSLVNIPKQESPAFPSWNAVIITHFPGASPQKVEELITEKIEEKMKEVDDLKDITSTSKTGVSYVSLAIKEHIEEVKPIWDKVREKLTDIQGQMPQGSSTPYLNNDFGKTKSIVLAITGDGFGNRELIEVAKDLKKELALVEYVSRIDILGEQEERIYLEASTTKLSALGISPNVIFDIMASQNILSSGGEVKVGPKSVRIQPTGEFQSIDDIKKTVITLPGHKNVFLLEDLFIIERRYLDPPKTEIRYMGEDAVTVVIEMQDNGQIIELGNNIKELLDEKEKETYLGIDFHILNFQPKWVQLKIAEFGTNLYQATLIVAIVMILLLGWREGVIVSVLIPFSFMITLILMNAFTIPLHQISIAALIIALGMLVDNGIVMTESISNYIKAGFSPTEASIKAAKELSVPLLTATATTVAAFLPIALAESAVGIFTRSITYVVGMVLLSSFFVAMTIIPVLCVKLIKVKQKAEPKKKKSSLFSSGYNSFMNLCLKYKYLAIGCVILVFIGVIQMMGMVRTLFFPPSDRAQFSIDFFMPEGTDYRETKNRILRVERHLLETYPEEIDNMAIYIGKGGPRFYYALGSEQQNPNYAQVIINNHKLEDTLKMIPELQDYFFKNYPDAKAIVKTMESGPPVGAPIQVEVYGKRLDKLYTLAQKVQAIVEQVPGARDVRDNWGAQIPKISIAINQDQARRIGVSTKDIARELTAYFSGSIISEFREGDRSIPITLRSTKEERNTLNSLQNINLATSQGITVPLLQIANIEMEWEAGKIRHNNRRRTITIEAYSTGERMASQILADIQKQLKGVQFEPGYGVKYAGEAEKSGTANKSIMDKVPIAFAILMMILVAQFSNVRKMLIILMTIPLSFIGIILGLLVVDYPFGFMAFLGVISLAGIVVNNAILLLEQIEADLQAGKPPIEAIISAGQRRSFPIILTTITTVCGLIPLAISGEFWGPMAVTIIGGLLVSTMLTLVVIPTLYAILFGVPYTKPILEPIPVEEEAAQEQE